MRNLYLKFILLIGITFSSKSAFCVVQQTDSVIDTLNISTAQKFNTKSYNLRLIDPEQALRLGQRAEVIARKIDAKTEIAEANRVIGISFEYLNESDSSLSHYTIALKLFQQLGDAVGEAKVLNNIGNLWREIDHEKALDYYRRTLKVAEKFKQKDLVAGSLLNIGNTYMQNKQYEIALKYYKKSRSLFVKLNNPIGITQSTQNIGVIYNRLNNLTDAEHYLLEANKMARDNSLNHSIAAINMTLSSIYIKKKQFDKAEKYLEEGLGFVKLLNDERKMYEYIYTQHDLERKRNNFKKALEYLKQVYTYDSVNYKKNLASNILLVQQTFKQQQTQKENELTIQSQRNAKKLSLAIGIVAVLSFFVIFLLIKSNKRSKQSNQQLQELNDEIITQKNKVDRINHQLEELIAERTKDLIIKNQKLSEYSSHLSHQIRGPVATLKGLMMLVEENMVQSNEIAPQIKKCVDDIDTKIMDINDALNDPTKKGLS